MFLNNGTGPAVEVESIQGVSLVVRGRVSKIMQAFDSLSGGEVFHMHAQGGGIAATSFGGHSAVSAHQVAPATAFPSTAISATSLASGAGSFITECAICFAVRVENNQGGSSISAKGDVLIQGDVNIQGTISATNLKSAVVQTEDYGQRRLYAVESPGVWFEDFGTGLLADGSATVDFDPIFAQTVNTEAAYHVFLTPLGDTPGLYLAEKAAGHFVVKEVQGGVSNIAFDYRIVAKRLGYEEVRLERSDS